MRRRAQKHSSEDTQQEGVEMEEECVARPTGGNGAGSNQTAAEKERLLGTQGEEAFESEEEYEDEEEDDEDEKQEQMRLAHTHAMLQQELERACETLGVVEDSAATNKETLDIYSKYGASLGTAKGLVRTVGRNRMTRTAVFWCCVGYFVLCVAWVLFCRFPRIW